MNIDLQVFIYSYAHFQEASHLFYSFLDRGIDTHWLNCAHERDPIFPATNRIHKLPNVYYSGQWNEMLKLADKDVLLIINADVFIPNFDYLLQRLNKYYFKYGSKAGIYAPNHYWTPWTYNPALLPNLGSGLKCVPATDSTIWALRTSLAKQIGPMNLKINRLGWGIEVLAAFYCAQSDQYVVRDYTIKCDHPMATAYNRETADMEFRDWIQQLDVGPAFWHYYDSRDKYDFGWIGDDAPLPIKLA